MIRTILVATLALIPAGAVQAAGWRLQFQPNTSLRYKVLQTLMVSEVVAGKKTESSQRIDLTKRWDIVAVDAAGVATIRKSITALRIEQKTFKGEVLVYDSANLDKSDPQMRQQLSGYVGKTLAELRVDSQGRVVEVKRSDVGKPGQFEIELPLVLLLPDGLPEAGQAWKREFAVTLDPPAGTGEKFEAMQEYTLKSLEGATATIGLTTTFKALPKAVADQIPLLQFQPKGEIVFDTKLGQVRSITMDVVHELKNHQGEGSGYSFKRSYTEQFVDR
jgi:hypothetical protein